MSWLLICHACHHHSNEYNSKDDAEYQRDLEDAKEKGWLKREFTKGVDPWFCSVYCAYESHAAKYIEESQRRKKAFEFMPMYHTMMMVGIFLFVIGAYFILQVLHAQ